MIGLMDLGSLIAAVTFGIALLGSETKGVQAGVVVMAAAGWLCASSAASSR